MTRVQESIVRGNLVNLKEYFDEYKVEFFRWGDGFKVVVVNAEESAFGLTEPLITEVSSTKDVRELIKSIGGEQAVEISNIICGDGE